MEYFGKLGASLGYYRKSIFDEEGCGTEGAAKPSANEFRLRADGPGPVAEIEKSLLAAGLVV